MGSASDDGAKFCPRCGKELLALPTAVQICDCGWKSKSKLKQALLFAGISAGVGGVIAAWVYFAHNYRMYFPDKISAHEYMIRGKGAFESGDHMGGLLQLQKATTFDPKDPELRADLARAYGYDGQYREAAEQMAEAVRLAPAKYTFEIELGNLYGLSGDKEKSIRHLRAAVALAPKETAPKENLVLAYLESGDNENALKSIRELAAEAPKKAGIWSKWADHLKNMSKPNEALDVLEKGLKELPDSAELHIQAAQIMIEKGEKDKAIPYLRKAAELQPAYAEHVAMMLDAASKDKKRRSYLIPLQRFSSASFYANVLINDKVRAKLVVDSGCSTTLLSPAIGRKLGIDPRTLTVRGFRSVNGVGLAAGTFLDSISAGQAKAHHVQAVFFDMHDPYGDGLLGMSFLGRYQFTLDARRRQLILNDK